jgi:hypothetical protein
MNGGAGRSSIVGAQILRLAHHVNKATEIAFELIGSDKESIVERSG